MRCFLVLLLPLTLVAALPGLCRAETALPEEIEQVCPDWLTYMVHQTGDWGGATDPSIIGVQEILVENMILARVVPGGSVEVEIGLGVEGTVSWALLGCKMVEL